MNTIDEIQSRFWNIIDLQDLDNDDLVYDLFEDLYTKVHVNSYALVVSQIMEESK